MVPLHHLNLWDLVDQQHQLHLLILYYLVVQQDQRVLVVLPVLLRQLVLLVLCHYRYHPMHRV